MSTPPAQMLSPLWQIIFTLSAEMEPTASPLSGSPKIRTTGEIVSCYSPPKLDFKIVDGWGGERLSPAATCLAAALSPSLSAAE